MPQVKFDYVVSFSSEDPDHPASNLLPREVSKKKWLCKKGEPSCSVVLQLSKSCKISTVRIGVQHAAMVELLVGRSETPNEPFHVLVAKSVFVSARESRAESFAECVRSFTGAALVSPAADQRWDRLRLVLHQPYNKHIQYGLTFVHVFEEDAPAPTAALRVLPAVSAQSDEDDDEFTPGELFAAHRQLTDTGAQIRRASLQAINNQSDESSKLTKTKLSRHKTERQTIDNDAHTSRGNVDMHNRDTDASGSLRKEKLDIVIDELPVREYDRQIKRNGKRDRSPVSDSPHKETNNKHNSSNNDRRQRVKHESRDESVTTENNATSHTEWDADRADRIGSEEPLAGCVLVFSGYEHPERGQLQRLARRLGAAVQRDLTPAATHLVCAFPNTPKLRAATAAAASGAGPVRAVRGEWLRECAARRRRLPWRAFATLTSDARDYSSHSDASDDTVADASSDSEEEAAVRLRARVPALLAGRRVRCGHGTGAGRCVRAYGALPGAGGERVDLRALWRSHAAAD